MDVAPAAGYALANVSEASLAAFLIIAIARGAPLAERRGLAGLLVGMLVAPWLGGSIAVGVIALDGGDVDATSYIGHWWIGDALGILLVGGVSSPRRPRSGVTAASMASSEHSRSRARSPREPRSGRTYGRRVTCRSCSRSWPLGASARSACS